MGPRGGGRGRAIELGQTGSSSSRPVSLGADIDDSTPRGIGRGRGNENGRNGSISSRLSSSANLEGSTPTSDDVMTSHVGDATSANAGLRRLTISRGVLRPGNGISGSITSSFKRSLHSRAFAWKLVPEDKKLEYFDEFRKEYTWDPAIEALVHKAW